MKQVKESKAGILPWIRLDGAWYILFQMSLSAPLKTTKANPFRGGRKPGEQIAEAAWRELWEESGHVLDLQCLRDKYPTDESVEDKIDTVSVLLGRDRSHMLNVVLNMTAADLHRMMSTMHGENWRAAVGQDHRRNCFSLLEACHEAEENGESVYAPLHAICDEFTRKRKSDEIDEIAECMGMLLIPLSHETEEFKGVRLARQVNKLLPQLRELDPSTFPCVNVREQEGKMVGALGANNIKELHLADEEDRAVYLMSRDMRGVLRNTDNVKLFEACLAVQNYQLYPEDFVRNRQKGNLERAPLAVKLRDAPHKKENFNRPTNRGSRNDNNRGPTLCRFFNTPGGCTNDSCRFLHK